MNVADIVLTEPVRIALIAAVSAAVSAIVAGLMNLRVRDRAREHEQELARLQTELRGTEERLRSSLARDLASHESGLRVAGEMELRLLALASEATMEATKVFAEAIDVVMELAHQVSEGKVTSTTAVDDVLSKLLHTGMLLPPELDDPYFIASGSINEAVVAIGRQMQSPKASRPAAIEAAKSKLIGHLSDFHAQARAWKRAAWSEMRGTRKGAGE